MTKKQFRQGVVALLCVCLFISGQGVSWAPAEQESLSQTGITQTLISLLAKQDSTKIKAEDYQSTSLRQIITFGTPSGYRIKLRYLNFGVALVEALKVSRDPELKRRLIEMVQWSRDPEVRAEAIVTLASLYNPAHKKYFKEALLDSKVGIRFAAVEALQMWGQPEALDLLKMSMGRDWSPLMQAFSAQALLSLGDKSGIAILWKLMDHNSWVVRAMAARYLGDYANPSDYEKLMDYLNNESKNDYVATEIAIAALKLISKKGDKVYYSPMEKGWADNEEVRYTLGKDNVITLEPLVIVPPRARIPKSLQIASRINSRLMTTLKEKLSVELDPIQAQDPILQDLYSLVTPTGFALKTRYSELSYLMVEALAGTTDLMILSELKNTSAMHSNSLVRATAMVALSYNRDPADMAMIQEGLRDKNALVRMGALEAIEIGRFSEALSSVFAIASDDPCPALQAYAAQVLAKFGDAGGRNLLITRINDLDWPTRALSYWYMGRYGNPSDYTILLSRLVAEENPFVQAEICLALQRLTPIDE